MAVWVMDSVVGQTFCTKKKWKKKVESSSSTLKKPVKSRDSRKNSDSCCTNKRIFSVHVSCPHQFPQWLLPLSCEDQSLNAVAQNELWTWDGPHVCLFCAGQAYCICAQVLCSSPVVHFCGELAHHGCPHLALTEAEGKWLFPTLRITAKQCY